MPAKTTRTQNEEKRIVSASLTPVAYKVYCQIRELRKREKLNERWFSEWVSKKLCEQYLEKVGEQVLKELIIEHQKQRDDIEEIMGKNFEKLNKIKEVKNGES